MSIFESFKKLQVLVIGDVMIDRYLSGKVSRISPEAPVPIVLMQNRENRLGGAANVAMNLRALGATPYLFSIVGRDEAGNQLLELLPQHQLFAKGIIQSAYRKTTIKTRILASNQHLLRVDDEDTHDLHEQEAARLIRDIRDFLENKEVDLILFQDYNKGVLTDEIIRAIILEAVKRDIPTAVDPKSRNFWAYKHITLFKPNLKEIQAQLPFSLETTEAGLKEASKYIQNKLGNPYTLITLSEKGLYLDKSGAGKLMPTQERSIVDVCGAGDTVFAIAGLGLAAQLNPSDIGLLANLAGGQVCEKVGVVPIDVEQLAMEFEQMKKYGHLQAQR
ncbi:MAG TPA: bifunctional ADP-heptose synthase [Saprospiraceae bacterium]|nr:bifunctional ADP-heptose synthase [Saprospiraceae bacterium]HMQ85834.1 bifunctional ADP-heptose synthase [Saprospiraceae bacterium]